MPARTSHERRLDCSASPSTSAGVKELAIARSNTPSSERRGHSGVDGVAALLKDLRADARALAMLGDDHAAGGLYYPVSEDGPAQLYLASFRLGMRLLPRCAVRDALPGV